MSRVLLIERDRVEHEALATQLRADGHFVVEVTGREQLGTLLSDLHDPEGDQQLPDLIISDAEESDGGSLDDLLQQAHELRGGTPVILLIDASDPELVREAAALEAAYVFFNPCEVDALRRATQRLG